MLHLYDLLIVPPLWIEKLFTGRNEAADVEIEMEPQEDTT